MRRTENTPEKTASPENKSKVRTTYKVVEIENDKIKTLFHGVNGSRTIQLGEWLEADVKWGRDGSGQHKKWYRTGFHSILSLEDAENFLERSLKTRKELLRIVECKIKDTWPKDHSPHPIILSRYVKLIRVVK